MSTWCDSNGCRSICLNMRKETIKRAGVGLNTTASMLAKLCFYLLGIVRVSVCVCVCLSLELCI